jgi:competence ComEA-like helix-hairpin-helix protein
MIGFTPQERRIVVFLVAALLVGSAVSLYRRHQSYGPSQISVTSQRPTDGDQGPDSTEWAKEKSQPTEKVDINNATEKQLQSLPGIGSHLAQRIVEHRNVHGPFSSPQDITAVRGIGQKTLLRFCDLIICEPPNADSAKRIQKK